MKQHLIRILVHSIIKISNTFPFFIRVVLWHIKWVVKHIVRYRSDVILTNLKNSFGNEWQGKPIIYLKNIYYDVLFRYIKESVAVASWPLEKLISKIILKEKKTWQLYFRRQKSTILMASHYGNWEMNIVILPALIQHRVIAFYKPISDPTMDEWMLKIRSTHGLELYPIEQTLRIMTALHEENIIYIFIGDQSPFNMNNVYWNTFLHQNTPWLNGAEKLAGKFKYPVLYLKQKPENNTDVLYTLELEIITEQPEKTHEGEITEIYSRILEKEILAIPQYWLWSHKRWKRAHLRG